jgi:hypothetical protein
MVDEHQGPGEEGRYRVSSTSRHSARVESQTLSLRRNDDGSLTRRIIEPLVVENAKQPEATVKVTFAHERRKVGGTTWDAEPAFNLGTLKAGEEIRLALSAEETLALHQHLERLYRVGEQGVLRGEHLVTVVDEREAAILRGSAKEILEKLIATNGPDLFSIIDSIEPDLLTAAAVARTYAARHASLETFEREIGGSWTETDWQHFFEDNTWIFGHGLDYRFLVTAQAQPNYGGASVEGKGGERGDFLMNTEGDVRFAVLVEIKKPGTPLLARQQYRNGAWQLDPDLTGGAAQIQANCDHWATEGSQTRRNRQWLEERAISVVEPKGILLIGNTRTLDSPDKVETFERYRRNLWNPEVLTYDELLERARFLVEQAAPADPDAEPAAREPRGRAVAPQANDLDLDDLPF